MAALNPTRSVPRESMLGTLEPLEPPGSAAIQHAVLSAAFGDHALQVLPAAAGTEYGHVASLIHDDVIDGDDVRRGRPSVPFRFGLENAIVSGDSLLFGIF